MVRTARSWLFLGPAFVAAVAYVDPGNFATNIQAGAQVGYELVWIVLVTDAHAGLSSWYEPSTAQELLRRPDLTLLLIKEL